MRKLSEKWVPKCLNADQKPQRCQSSAQYVEIFGSIQMISFRDWWPCTKSVYITMTRRLSNNQRNGGITAHPAPKNSECKNPLENFTPRFFGIKTASSSIIFQRAKLSTPSITHLCWCNCRTFWRKNAVRRSPWVLARHCPGSPGICNPEETGLHGLPMSWSLTLFSGSGPVDLPPLPWTEKGIERSPFLVRRGGHCCRGDLVGRTIFWFFFFEWLANVRATGYEVYWASWGVCWINLEFGRCSLFPSSSG